MKVKKVNNNLWNVVEEKHVLANIFLDGVFSVRDVVLYGGTAAQRRRIKELIVSYSFECKKKRIILRSNEEESAALMDFGRIAKEIEQMEDVEINFHIEQLSIKLVEGRFFSPLSALDWVIGNLRREFRVRLFYQIVPGRNLSFQVIFGIKSNHSFCIWKNVPAPSRNFGVDSPGWAHITPAYHPVLKGAKNVGLIDAATNSLVGKHEMGIDAIYSPTESRRNGSSSDSEISSWCSINHPFCAKGRSLEVKLSATQIVSFDACELLLRVLTAALDLDDLFLGVRGGFCPPYEYHQVAHGAKVRGTESMVAWEYNTLKKEGKLEDSFVPSWFVNEGWVKEYSGVVA